jgi:hypothetical protein
MKRVAKLGYAEWCLFIGCIGLKWGRNVMPVKDPLKIIGQPPPTEAERQQVMAFAEATCRPAKFCRAALIEAKGD